MWIMSEEIDHLLLSRRDAAMMALVGKNASWAETKPELLQSLRARLRGEFKVSEDFTVRRIFGCPKNSKLINNVP